MKAEDFVEKLKEIAPSIEDYIKQGFDRNYAINDRKTFYAEKLKDSPLYNDELLNLISCYKTNDLIIGQIKFYNAMEEKTDYYIVGEVEADWLIIDKTTGEIRTIELHSEQSLWKCASNGGSFLEAILLANRFFVDRSLDDNLFNNQRITCSVAEECSERAGGEMYIDFYNMLIGCFE